MGILTGKSVPRHLLDLSTDDLAAWLAERGLPRYRAGQIQKWLFAGKPIDFDNMTNLPQPLRVDLAEAFTIWTSRVAAHRSADDNTHKLLLEWPDANSVECVLLADDREHRAACVSSQVGCAMGCAFCASGLDGVARNLTAGEILEQLLRLQHLLDPPSRISHIVVMGMGEPLANIEAVMRALAVAASPAGLGISARRITISTVGLPDGIRRLAAMGCPYHLAVSLHAADDELRNQLVPANRKFGIQAVLEAADEYFERTGRRITYEYVLLDGVNDRPEDAGRLAQLLAGRSALVNLIPFNPVHGLPYRTPPSQVTARFAESLERGGISVKIRYRKGDRIDAACGQLRRSISPGNSAEKTPADS